MFTHSFEILMKQCIYTSGVSVRFQVMLEGIFAKNKSCL